MAAQSSRREVELTPEAVGALREIWEWNAEGHTPSHADAYLQFLATGIESLAVPDAAGRPVPGRPEVWYRLIRRRPGGHGHIVVYRVANNRVTLLRIFHTAQDWQAALSKETPPS
jgi:plasmid stabilization system protein ParE